jgi:hypothetical protein
VRGQQAKGRLAGNWASHLQALRGGKKDEDAGSAGAGILPGQPFLQTQAMQAGQGKRSRAGRQASQSRLVCLLSAPLSTLLAPTNATHLLLLPPLQLPGWLSPSPTPHEVPRPA